MLFENAVLNFINTYRKEFFDLTKFFFKDERGHFIDANDRTVYIGCKGYDNIVDKQDCDLSWSEYSDQYFVSDSCALQSQSAIIKIEDTLDLNNQHTKSMTIKQPVFNAHGSVVGVFGACIDIEQLTMPQLF